MTSHLKTDQEKVLGNNIAPEIKLEEEPKEQIVDKSELIKYQQPYSTSACTTEGEAVTETTVLAGLTRLQSKVAIDKQALERENAQLKQEENDLKAILKQYLEGITVRENTVAAPNPLLVVNNKVPQPIRIIEGNAEDVDAAHVIHIQRL
eukprot:TRINITY_DN3043_c0_g1_i1.p1 TRINITY_DN3043_c0_g1~~TRINITY_DN3043_c0_g1_i1.p1  ORF type:complete len:150 (+),score=46.98 TRINITY_DN3043_c0_g1_i1:95-544(+)